MAKVKQEVLDVLKRSIADGMHLQLPLNMDRKLYQDTMKVLETMGGKWSRKLKVHIFERDVQEVIDIITTTGEYEDLQKDFNFFFTPHLISRKMVDLLEVQDDHMVLEPSAGTGHLIKFLPNHANVMAVEKTHVNCEHLMKNFPDITLAENDFLSIYPDHERLFDRIIMNPPFFKTNDVHHFNHAVGFLKPGGIIVAIIGEEAFFREGVIYRAFRDYLETTNAYVEKLPDGAFKEAGTMVTSRIVKIVKR